MENINNFFINVPIAIRTLITKTIYIFHFQVFSIRY